MKPLISFFLTASLLTLHFAFADIKTDNLDTLEIRVFGKKQGSAPFLLRLERLEQALELPSNPKLSMSYRFSRLFKFSEQQAAAKRKQLAIAAYNRAIDETAAGHTEAAMSSYRQALQLDASLIQVYNNLGNILLERQQYKETIALYREGMRLNPDEPLLHRNLGILYEHSGKIQEAVAEYELYLKKTKTPDPPIQAIVDTYRAHRKTSINSPDYLSATMQSSDGHRLIWPNQLNPVKVYVNSIDLSQVSDTELVLPIIHNSLQEWEKATAGRVRFELVTVPESANILIMLRKGPLTHPYQDIGHTEFQTPESQLRNQSLHFVTITLNIGDEATERKFTPEYRRQQFSRMALHEIGHAIGIWGHSPDPGDIMFTHPITSKLSQRDIKTIRLLYSENPSNRDPRTAPSKTRVSGY